MGTSLTARGIAAPPTPHVYQPPAATPPASAFDAALRAAQQAPTPADPTSAVLGARQLLARSVSGQQVLQRMDALGLPVVVTQAPLGRGEGTYVAAAYATGPRTLYLSGPDLGREPLSRLAATLTHEVSHAWDHATGQLDALRSALLQGVRGTVPPGRASQVEWVVQLASEVRAHRASAAYDASVGIADLANPAARPDGSGAHDFDHTWNALLSGPYNPHGRSASPDDYAIIRQHFAGP